MGTGTGDPLPAPLQKVSKNDTKPPKPWPGSSPTRARPPKQPRTSVNAPKLRIIDYGISYLHIRAASSQPTLANKVIAKIKKKKNTQKKILLLPRGAKETQRESPHGAAARRDSGEGTGGDMGTSPSCCATLGPHEPLGKISQAVEHPQGSVPTEHPITRARRAGGLQTLSTKPLGPPRPRGARTKAPGSSLAPAPPSPPHLRGCHC